jgi:golgin subfamily A member 4
MVFQEKIASHKKKAQEQAATIQSLEDANKQLRESTPDMPLAHGDIDEYKTKVATLESDLEEYRKLVVEMQGKLEENQDDSMVTMSGKELGLALQLNETKDCLEMAITEEKQMRNILAEKEEELNAALEQQTKLLEKIAKMESEEQGMRHILDETIQIAETTKEQCTELQNELAYSKEKISELEHAIDVTEKSSEADKEKLLKLKAALAECKKKLAESVDLEVKTSEQLMDRLAEMETFTKRDAELQEKIAELESAKVDSEEVQRQASAKAEELQAALYEIERLRGCLSVVDERLAEIPSLTATIQELQQQKSAELQELYEKLAEAEIFKAEAVEAEILRRNLADLEECKAKNAEELNLQLAEIEELNKKLAETENLKNVFEKDLQELRATSMDNEELQLRLKESDELAATVSELESALDEAKKDINARKVYAEKLEEELACSKAARNFLDRSANTTADMHLTLDNKSMDQILSLESVNLNLRSELQKLADEYDTLSSEKSSLEERVAQLETEVGDFKEKATNLKNQVALLTAKEIKNMELVSNLRSEIVQLKESIDKLELELETSNESLQNEQALAKQSVVTTSAELEEKHFKERQELFALSDKLAATEKMLHQAQNDNDNLQQICNKKSAELAEIESKRSLLSSEKASCWQELLEARQNYDQVAEEKAQLMKNVDMYKCNMEQMRASMTSAGSDIKVQLEELKDDAIRMNNEKYEVELQLQEKMELMAEFESKITHTNTLLNRISGERDILSIRLQEARASLEEVTAQRDELSEKCRETDSEYEELLVVYREVEGKSKTFQTQSIKLRQEKDELALKVKNLGNEVSSINAVDHSKCQLQAKEMEKLIEEKNRDMMSLKRELSNVRGEFMHLKFRISNEPGIFDESEEHKQKIKEAEQKITLLRDEVISFFS